MKKKLFVVNTLSNVGFNILVQLLGFFIVPLFVKNLGQELYGIWALSRTVMGYFQLLDLGVSGGIVKYIAEDRAINNYEDMKSTINTSIMFYGAIGLMVFLSIFLFSDNILSLFSISIDNKNTANNILKIAAVMALFAWPNIAISSALDGLLKYLPKNILLGINSIANSVIILVMIYMNYSLEVIIIISSLTNLIPWIGGYMILKKSIPSWRFTFSSVSFGKLKEIFSFSLWVFIQQLIVIAIYQTDQLIIGLLLPVASITTYVVVTRLFYFVRQINGMFLSAIWPTIFAANKIADKTLIEKMVNKGARYISIIIVPMSTLGFSISGELIRLWMGEYYVQYAFWAKLLFVIWFFAPMFGVFGNVLVGVGHIKLINIMGILSTILNLVVGILLTRYYGIGGVILGTVVSYLIFMPIQFPIFMRILKLDWKVILFPNLRIISCCIFVMAIAVCIIPLLNIASISILFLYSFIYLILNYAILFIIFFDKEEKRELLQYYRKLKLKYI